MNRVLVTGATGFLGRAVVTALAEDGMTVRAGVRSDPNPPFKADIEVAKHPDLAQPIDWRPLLEGTDIVIHLAGIAHITTSLHPDLYDRVNHLATAQAAAAAVQCGIRRFVFVSSIRAQCGPAAEPRPDRTRSSRAVRFVWPLQIGGRSGRSFIWRAFHDFEAGSSLRSWGQRKSCYVAAGGTFALAIAGEIIWQQAIVARHKKFYFGAALRAVRPADDWRHLRGRRSRNPPSIAELIAMMREAQGRRPRLVPIPPALFELPLRLLGRGELWRRLGGDLRVDPGKLIAAGWKPPEDTRTGIAAMVQAAQTA